MRLELERPLVAVAPPCLGRTFLAGFSEMHCFRNLCSKEIVIMFICLLEDGQGGCEIQNKINQLNFVDEICSLK